jgi:predicted nucleic acid-binding protein
MGKKLKIYLDTSVINFLFAEDSPDLKKITIDFFDNYSENYDLEISDVVLAEINRTKNIEKKELLIDAIDRYNLKVTKPFNDDINKMAQEYIDANIIPKNKFEDAQHVAFAVYYEFDILLSWNFKHLANFNKQMSINGLNLQKGISKSIYLFNPMEVIYEK